MTNWQARKLSNGIENAALIIAAVWCGLSGHSYWAVLLVALAFANDVVLALLYSEDTPQQEQR